MYKNHISSKPKKFGTLKFSSSKPARQFKGGNFKRSNNRPKRKGFSERIDFSRFIKKSQHIEEKPYISKHTFIDFPFNPQIHKNIARAGLFIQGQFKTKLSIPYFPVRMFLVWPTLVREKLRPFFYL